jgi:bacterioferritin
MPTPAKTEEKTSLINALNEDLAREFQAIVRYVQFAASVTGPHRPQLSALFSEEVKDELAHATFLANKIASYGGTPTTEIPPVEPIHDPKRMLERVYEAEREDVEHYTRRVEEAEKAGDVGLKVKLEDFVQDETEHMEEVAKILDGWR